MVFCLGPQEINLKRGWNLYRNTLIRDWTAYVLLFEIIVHTHSWFGLCICIQSEWHEVLSALACTSNKQLLNTVLCILHSWNCHELRNTSASKSHSWLLGDINAEPLTVPVGCTSVSYSVVQNSSGTAFILLSFIVLLSRTFTFSNSTCNQARDIP
jgi:hypothetical protein